MYDLFVNGIDAFYQRRPGAKRLVRREPLSGLSDGINTVFLTAHHPFLYNSFGAYLYNAKVDAGGFVQVDAEGGLVEFNTAPLVQPLADYTAVPLTQRQLIYYCLAGFDLMESLWQRGLALSISDLAYIKANGEDDHAFIATSPTDFSDPICGSLNFSTSKTQQALLARCIELAYLDSLTYESSASDISVRERAGGIAIDSTKRPANLLAMKREVLTDVRRALIAAMDEYYPGNEHYSANNLPPHTTEYEDIWHWQSGTDGTVFPKWINL